MGRFAGLQRQTHSNLISSVSLDRTVRPPAHAANLLLAQQQALGNQAAQRFAESCPVGLPSPSVCRFGGACHTCRAPAQAKLTVNKPGDEYEQEADRVADQLMRMPEPRVQVSFRTGNDDQWGLRIKPLAARISPLIQRETESAPTVPKASAAQKKYLQELWSDDDKYRLWMFVRTRSGALAFAESLDTLYPEWLTKLPSCPCTFRDAKCDTRFYEPFFGACPSKYHPGATDGVRTGKCYTSIEGTCHGQQCCYDGTGCLIREDEGAGTPDLWAPVEHLTNHLKFDVDPHESLGWRIYNRYWRPNKGKNCRPCPLSKTEDTSEEPVTTESEDLQVTETEAQPTENAWAEQISEWHRQEVIDRFTEGKFVRIYLRHRARIKKLILRDLRRRRKSEIRLPEGTATLPGWREAGWWDCFLNSGEESYYDELAGMTIIPKKPTVPPSEAVLEIWNFVDADDCPHFNKLHKRALEKHMRRID